MTLESHWPRLSLLQFLLLAGAVMLVVRVTTNQRAPVSSPPAPSVTTTPRPTPTPAAPVMPASDPATAVTVDKTDCRLGGFGTVGICTITLRNTATVGFADLGYRLVYFGKSGTRIGDQSGVIYDTLPAGATKTFEALHVGFVPAQTARYVFTLRSGSSRIISAPRGGEAPTQ